MRRFLFLFLLMPGLILAAPVNVIYNHDLETEAPDSDFYDGEGWMHLYNNGAVRSSAQARSGSYSLLDTQDTKNWRINFTGQYGTGQSISTNDIRELSFWVYVEDEALGATSNMGLFWYYEGESASPTYWRSYKLNIEKNTWVKVDATEFLHADKQLSAIILYDSTTSYNYSRYYDDIVLSVVPVPGAVWLFGSALAGLGWIRRKQAKVL